MTAHKFPRRPVQGRTSSVETIYGCLSLSFANTEVKLKLSTGHVDWFITHYGMDTQDWIGRELILTCEGGIINLTTSAEHGIMKEKEHERHEERNLFEE